MKIDAILTADWHITSSIPVCRKDNYVETILGKIDWVADLQREYDCPVWHAGDLFNKSEPRSFILGKIMNRLPNQFYTVPGNHDLQNHNIELLEKSGLTVLSEAGKIEILSNDWSNNFRNYKIYGASYGSKIPKILNVEVLMCHEMIYQSPEHWQKENGSQALAFLKKHKGYQLIVTGHNHKPFTAQHEGRLLVNPGSLMRMAADQKDYKPRVYLWNKETNTVKIKYIPIDKDAVETIYLEKSKARDDRMNAFLDALLPPKGCEYELKDQMGLNYEKNLENYLANNRVRTSVKDVIYECIGGGV